MSKLKNYVLYQTTAINKNVVDTLDEGGSGEFDWGEFINKSMRVLQTINSQTINLVGENTGSLYECEVELADLNEAATEVYDDEFGFCLHYMYGDLNSPSGPIFGNPQYVNIWPIEINTQVVGHIWIDDGKIIFYAKSETAFNLSYSMETVKLYIASQEIYDIFKELYVDPPS